DARDAHRQRVRAQEQHGAHDLARRRGADARAVRAEQVQLQRAHVVRGNVLVLEDPEPGGDAVDDALEAHRVVDDPPARLDAAAGLGGQLHAPVPAGSVHHVVQRQPAHAQPDHGLSSMVTPSSRARNAPASCARPRGSSHSFGSTGSTARNGPRYDARASRGSQTTSTPRSDARRINRPTPCRNRITASGTASCRNGSSPRSRRRSARASTTGSSGTENGSLATTRTSSASPGKSTPSHRLWTPSKTAPRASRKRSASSPAGPSRS